MFDTTNTPVLRSTENLTQNISVPPMRPTRKGTRRVRTRPLDPCQSPAIITRQAARNPRRSVAPSKLATQFLQLSLEGTDAVCTEVPSAFTGCKNLRIPKHLSRPRVPAVATPAEVSDIPLSYVQSSLEEVGPLLFQAASSIKANPPRTQLPRELQVDYTLPLPFPIESPSHLLAVHASSSINVSLFPVHSIVLSSNCANLPTLPPSSTVSLPGPVSLPVVPLRIPHPASFAGLMHYLYIKNTDAVIASLLPNNVCTAVDMKTLLNHIGRVYGFWANMMALGVDDGKLWDAVEDVWAQLTEVLEEKVSTMRA